MEPTIFIAPPFRGGILIEDLLKTEATITFRIDSINIKQDNLLFSIEYKEDFIFALSFQNGSIVVQRNNIVSVLTLDELIEKYNSITIFIAWSSVTLSLHGLAEKEHKTSTIETQAVVAPIELIRWARKQDLLPTEIYETEEKYRNKVYSILTSVNKKINEASAFKSFWNIGYDGQKIISREPKKEIELQPLIHCLLSDMLLINNIEIIPEYQTGNGVLDFLFMAQVKNLGIIKMCIEFKLAHSKNLKHGLLKQLPEYMNSSSAKYGAYCVLSFKGEWFDKPNIGEDKDMDFHINKIGINSTNSILDNIRTFIFYMAKPQTTSRAS